MRVVIVVDNDVLGSSYSLYGVLRGMVVDDVIVLDSGFDDGVVENVIRVLKSSGLGYSVVKPHDPLHVLKRMSSQDVLFEYSFSSPETIFGSMLYSLINRERVNAWFKYGGIIVKGSDIAGLIDVIKGNKGRILKAICMGISNRRELRDYIGMSRSALWINLRKLVNKEVLRRRTIDLELTSLGKILCRII